MSARRKFTLTIRMDGEAVTEPEGIAPIVEHVAEMLAQGYTSEPILLDINGNRVGSWAIS